MKSKIALGFLFAGLGITACTSWKTASEPQTSDIHREVATVSTWEPNRRAMALSSDLLAQISSSGQMGLKNAKLLTDNNRAFETKLNMVKNAQREIRMVYYIYSDDFSSSLLTSEVIAAAQRGVKVRILVDFITNYERLDLFQYMEQEGRGNIEVRFYGLPSEVVQRGAVYQTVPCSKVAAPAANQCESEKVATIQSMGNPTSTWFSKIYLTGLYGKNPTLLQGAIGIGGQFDPKTLMAGAKPTAEEKAKLKKFAELVFKAKMKNDLAAKIKVGIALQTYGTTLNPIMNEITGRLPFVVKGGQDWDHITDFTHHKLLVVDGQKFQLGGRNIEDSYHTDKLKTQISESAGKYTFIDTDFYAESPQTAKIQQAFDRLFSFAPMTGGLKTVQALIPNEYDVNADAFKMSLGTCLQEGKATPQDLEACVNTKISKMPGYQPLADRLAQIGKNMTERRHRFLSAYKPQTDYSWNQNGDELTAGDLASAQAYYLENVNFKPSAPGKRSFGSKIGLEAESGKMLHAGWLKGLENACVTSAQAKQRTRVVLHAAYLYMPTNLVNGIGNMINGKWNCSFVDLALITNSFHTTDLNVINLFARYQVSTILSFNKMIEANAGTYVTANQNKARLKYYEYVPTADNTGVSLHTKVNVLGNDMIIGSANADVRSYFMDTNNGLYVRNAREMVRDYNAFIDQLISNKKVSDLTEEFATVSFQQFQKENVMILEALAARWDKKGKLSAAQKTRILSEMDRLGVSIQNTTKAIISAPHELMQNHETGSTAQKIEELDRKANTFDDMWKIL